MEIDFDKPLKNYAIASYANAFRRSSCELKVILLTIQAVNALKVDITT